MSRNISPLRTERLQRHWSQRELAERIGASFATVKRWERQETIPGPYFRLKLTALFGQSEEALGLREASPLPAGPEARNVANEGPTVPPSPAIPSFWTVPYLRNPYFIGRDELFGLLTGHFTTALMQPLALTGLGGIGKTQIAIEYAYRAQEQDISTHVFWLNAVNEETMLTSFMTIAALLPTFMVSEHIDQQKLVQAIKQWLEHCPQHWLLIFDNADDLSALQHYIPHYGNGSILLTTRVHAVGSLATPIPVDKMGFGEGMHLLLRRAQRGPEVAEEEARAAGMLVTTLDALPLALEQAGAYLEETGCTIEEYLRLYQNHRSALLARRGTQATDYPDSVATTWSLSFHRIHQVNPAAAQLLQACAFLAPDHIPQELFKQGAAYWPTLLQQAVSNPLTFNQLLEALLRFSLIKHLTEDRLLSLHRLVQVVQVEMLSLEEQHQWAERMVRAVHSLFPTGPGEDMSVWPSCIRYLEQMQACAVLIRDYHLRFVEAADLLETTGTYLRVHASYLHSEALYLQALHLRKEMLGAQHLQTGRSLHLLGLLYAKQRKYRQADACLQQALRIYEEQLEPQHTKIAMTLNYLVLLYEEWGKGEQAERYYQRALATQEEQVEAYDDILPRADSPSLVMFSRAAFKTR